MNNDGDKSGYTDLNQEKQKFKNMLAKFPFEGEYVHVCAGSSELKPCCDLGDNGIGENTRYVVKLYPHHQAFVVWDYERHRDIKGAGKSLYLSVDWNKICPSGRVFLPRYKCLGQPHVGIEKVYVVGMGRMDEFFEHIDDYMEFNDQDEGFDEIKNKVNQEPILKKILSKAEESHLIKRKAYSSTKKTRDENFRTSVLEAYNSKCAICQCDLVEVLQAAHERGFEAATTEYDDPRHGICLCANHHLMYDKELIDIDLSKRSIKVNDNRIKEMAWYQEFINNGGKISERLEKSKS